MGPYYDLFADAVLTSRRRSAHCTDIAELDTLTSVVQSLAAHRTPKETLKIARSSYCHRGKYAHRKKNIHHPRRLSRWYCCRDATPSPPMRG